jgi:FKBP-type peptidyl-prolyl cis-trans isomerase FklB
LVSVTIMKVIGRRLILLSLLGRLGTATDEAGTAFLQSNRDKDGVVEVTSGGWQYKTLVNGTGTYHPESLCRCLCHYEGRLVDGYVFDSSYERGEALRIAPNQVIDGWFKAMQHMVEGDKWEVYLPSDLGYGERGHPPDIPAEAALIFILEMIAVDCPQRTPALQCHLALGNDPYGSVKSMTVQGFCSEKEVTYIAKIEAWTPEKLRRESVRLGRLVEEGASMTFDLKEWIQRRLSLVQQLLDKADRAVIQPDL